jgi:inositol transport system substrate-binding protein
MKKLLSLSTMLFLVVAVLAGCGSPTPAAPAGGGGTPAPPAAEQFRVAFIARAQGDAFAAWLTNAMREEAENFPNITLDVFDGQASDEIVNSHIENAIVSQFDVIIVQPNNGEAQRPFVEQIVAAGIHAITTNARIEGIAGASSVDADPFEQGAVQARAGADQIPQGANVVVLNGPSGNEHSVARRAAWQAYFFDVRPDVNIVGEQIANWNKDEAMTHMEDWMQVTDRIEAIISMNDNMAAGAVEAVGVDPRFDGILVYGVDGTAEATLLIRDGVMTSTTLQSAYDLAELVMETAYQLLTGQGTEIHVDIDTPNITIDNVEEFIEMHRRAGAFN